MDYDATYDYPFHLGTRDPSKWYYDDSPYWIEINDTNRQEFMDYITQNPNIPFRYILTMERNEKILKYKDNETYYNKIKRCLNLLQSTVAVLF